jgi:hypothetical protein
MPYRDIREKLEIMEDKKSSDVSQRVWTRYGNYPVSHDGCTKHFLKRIVSVYSLKKSFDSKFR